MGEACVLMKWGTFQGGWGVTVYKIYECGLMMGG